MHADLRGHNASFRKDEMRGLTMLHLRCRLVDNVCCAHG